MGIMNDVPIKDLREVMQNVNIVLEEDLEALKKEDVEYRVDLLNKIKSDFNRFRSEIQPRLSGALKIDHRGDFKLAQLLLAASFQANNEGISPGAFKERELELIQDFEKYKIFDILSIEDIVERTHRRDGKIYELVMDYSQKQYDNLDSIIDDSSIEKDLIYVFNKRYIQRQEKIKNAVKEYIDKHGPLVPIKEIKGVIDRIHELQQKQQGISSEVQKRIEELENKASDVEALERKNQDLQISLSNLERELYKTDVEKNSLQKTLYDLEAQKDSLLNQYSGIAGVWDEKLKDIEAKRKELFSLEEELRKERDHYQKEMKKENQKIIEDELMKVEQMKTDLLEKEHLLNQDKELLQHKKQEVDERLTSIKQALEEGETNRFVKTDVCKALELNFITRFDMKVNRTKSGFLNPIDNKIYKINDYEHLKSDSQDTIFDRNKERMSYTDIAEKLPLNMRSRYSLKNRILKLFKGSKIKIIIEALTLNHVDEYINNGFDSRAVTLSELLGLLTRYIESAEIGKYFHVIGIASPTGWDKKVKEMIESQDFAKNYVSRYISVCLVDSETGEVIFNKSDERIKDYIELYEPKFDSEKVESAKNKIREILKTASHVALDDLIKELQMETSTIKKAFYELEKEELGKVRYIKGVGLVFAV